MKKSLIILIILFSLPSNTASSNEYMKSILRDGNYMFRNGNFDGAIGMYEICANQYNISKYQKKCKDNIAKAKKDKSRIEKKDPILFINYSRGTPHFVYAPVMYGSNAHIDSIGKSCSVFTLESVAAFLNNSIYIL